MKHATPASLDRLEDVLAKLRAFDTLKEKSRGVFYQRGKAALHFHEDPAGLFADLRVDGEWRRFRVDDPPGHDALLAAIDGGLAR